MRMPDLEFRKADILECEARHDVRSLESIAATPGCPFEPIAQGPLAFGNFINSTTPTILPSSSTAKR